MEMSDVGEIMSCVVSRIGDIRELDVSFRQQRQMGIRDGVRSAHYAAKR